MNVYIFQCKDQKLPGLKYMLTTTTKFVRYIVQTTLLPAGYWALFSLNLNTVLDNNFPIFLSCSFNTNIFKLTNQNTRFKQILQRLNVFNLINTPTNFTTPEGTCPDFSITSEPAQVKHTSVSPPFCSTHTAKYCINNTLIEDKLLNIITMLILTNSKVSQLISTWMQKFLIPVIQMKYTPDLQISLILH